MKKWLQKFKDPIPVICWGLCLVIWFLGGVLSAARDLVAKSTGSLYEFALSAEDFELANLHAQPDGSYLTETDDPQMHWQNTDGIALRSLRMKASFSSEPREMCLYYINNLGE
ncbi:Tat pathway signal sequence, partial [gut metagenome]